MIIPNELVFAVDDQDNPIAPLPREYVHQHSIWHRISHVWIINNQKQILCQKRSVKKDTNPGKWEAFFGGHVGAGESYEENAVKEVHEETGLSFETNDLHFFTKGKSMTAKHFQSAFYVIWNGSIENVHIEQDEVEKVEWKDITELEQILFLGQDINWVHVLYEKEIIEKLKDLSFTE